MKVSIVGDAYAITSSIKVEDVKVLKKTKPEALKIVDEEGNDVFALDYIPNRPSISKLGITFGGVSRAEGEDGLLTLTGTIPSDVANAKEFVADIIAPAVAHIKTLEDRVATDAEQAKKDRKELLDSITIA